MTVRRKGNSHALPMGMQTGVATMELSLKIKNKTSHGSEIPLLGLILRKQKH